MAVLAGSSVNKYRENTRSIVFSLLFVVALVLLSVAERGFGQEEEKWGGGKYQPKINVAVVQFRVSEKTYSSVEAFRNSIEEAVQEALTDSKPQLIIFPEYTSVFVSLIPFYRIIEGADTFAGAFEKLKALYPEMRSIRDVFMRQDGYSRAVIDEVFGGLAARYHIYIIAGTYFHATGEGGELRNRELVYGPNGRVAYYQDKVFLTDFEREVLGLSPGKMEDAVGFRIGKLKIATTICRDTFFPVWSGIYSGYDLWIDIKANGVRYDAAEAERFLRALPARLKESKVPLGITDCLTGHFLDLFWEGESSVMTPYLAESDGAVAGSGGTPVGGENAGGGLNARGEKSVGIRFLSRASSCVSGEILYYNGHEAR